MRTGHNLVVNRRPVNSTYDQVMLRDGSEKTPMNLVLDTMETQHTVATSTGPLTHLGQHMKLLP